jgi:hypothetical protein
MYFVEQAERNAENNKKRVYILALIIGSAVASLVRFEFVFYLLGGSLALLKRHTNFSLLIGLGGIAGFTANAIHRFLYFQDILPNTIHAKRWPPYKDFQLVGIRSILARVKDGASGGFEVFAANSSFFFLLFALLLFFCILIRPRRGLKVLTRRSQGNASIAFALGFSLAVILFLIVTGRNWGYASRMQLMAVPLIVLLISNWLNQMSLEAGSLIPRSSVTKYVLAAIFIASILHFPVPDAALAGLKFNVLGKDPFSSDRLEKGYGVTPAGYRYTGQSVDRIREALGMESIKFLVPDVGGLGLGSPKINVLDSALLTSRELAKSGYSIFPKYFKSVKPDVIETHSMWSQVAGIYQLNDFRENYLPIAVDANWLYVRKEHYNTLLAKGLLENITCGSSCKSYRYRGGAIDEEYISSMDFDSNVKALSPAWRPGI